MLFEIFILNKKIRIHSAQRDEVPKILWVESGKAILNETIIYNVNSFSSLIVSICSGWISSFFRHCQNIFRTKMVQAAPLEKWEKLASTLMPEQTNEERERERNLVASVFQLCVFSCCLHVAESVCIKSNKRESVVDVDGFCAGDDGDSAVGDGDGVVVVDADDDVEFEAGLCDADGVMIADSCGVDDDDDDDDNGAHCSSNTHGRYQRGSGDGGADCLVANDGEGIESVVDEDQSVCAAIAAAAPVDNVDDDDGAGYDDGGGGGVCFARGDYNDDGGIGDGGDGHVNGGVISFMETDLDADDDYGGVCFADDYNGDDGLDMFAIFDDDSILPIVDDAQCAFALSLFAAAAADRVEGGFHCIPVTSTANTSDGDANVLCPVFIGHPSRGHVVSGRRWLAVTMKRCKLARLH